MRLALVHVDLVAEVDRVLGTDTQAGVAARAQVEVDRVVLHPLHFEGAEPAGNRRDLAGPHREAALAGLLARSFARHQHVHFQRARKPRGPVERGVRRADDQHLAARLVLHLGHGLRARQRRGREQRRDLRPRVPARFRPAGQFADVHEGNARLRLRRRRELGKQRRLLRAGDDQVGIGERRLERGDFLAAELAMHGQRFVHFQRLTEALGVDRKGAIAGAELKRLACQGHRPPPGSVPPPARVPSPRPPAPGPSPPRRARG